MQCLHTLYRVATSDNLKVACRVHGSLAGCTAAWFHCNSKLCFADESSWKVSSLSVVKKFSTGLCWGLVGEKFNIPHSTIFTMGFPVIFVECFIPEVFKKIFTFNRLFFHGLVEENMWAVDSINCSFFLPRREGAGNAFDTPFVGVLKISTVPTTMTNLYFYCSFVLFLFFVVVKFMKGATAQ